MYIGFKERIKFVYASIYAANKRRYNDCIGTTGNADNFLTTFLNYQDITGYSTLINKIRTALVTNYSNDSQDNTIVGICSGRTANVYQDKVKRYQAPDAGNNSGSSGGQATSALASDMATQLYLATGKCPTATSMEYFLNSLVSGNAPLMSTLLSHKLVSDVPLLSAALYAQIGGNTLLTSPDVSGSIQSGALQLSVGGGIINLVIASTGSGCNAVTWNNYQENDFIITGFKDIYYEPGSYNSTTGTYTFRIIATITRPTCQSEGLPLEIIIVGTTKAPVGECTLDSGNATPGSTVLSSESLSGVGTSGCDKRARFQNDLRDIFNVLLRAGRLHGSTRLNQNRSAVPMPADTYSYSNSILPLSLIHI